MDDGGEEWDDTLTIGDDLWWIWWMVYWLGLFFFGNIFDEWMIKWWFNNDLYNWMFYGEFIWFILLFESPVGDFFCHKQIHPQVKTVKPWKPVTHLSGLLSCWKCLVWPGMGWWTSCGNGWVFMSNFFRRASSCQTLTEQTSRVFFQFCNRMTFSDFFC